MKKMEIREAAFRIRFFGRPLTAVDGTAVYMDWSGSGFVLHYSGRVLAARFSADAGEEPSSKFEHGTPKWKIWPRAAVYLDGAETPYRVFTVDEPVKDEILFSADEPEEHVIRVVKLTEVIKSGLSLCSFWGDGDILPLEEERRPLIEFIGDSITCGYGNLATPDTLHFYSEDEDITKTYGALTAKALGMEPQFICSSGGCVRNKEWNGRPYSLAELYPYTDLWRSDKLGLVPEEWDFHNHPAKIVVINLGSNDIGSIVMANDPDKAEEEFVQDYYSLLTDIREKNGADTKIVCILGDLRYYLYDRIREAVDMFIRDTGDSKIFCRKLRPGSVLDRRGAETHPGIAAHERMSEELTSYLRSVVLKE